MNWTVEFDQHSLKQLSKLDKTVSRQILDYMEEISELADPFSRGSGLKGNLVGLWRYRVGDYRVICDIQARVVTVFVVEIGHRSEIYD